VRPYLGRHLCLSHFDAHAEGVDQFEQFALAAVAGEDRHDSLGGAGADDLLQLPTAVGTREDVRSGLVGDCVRSDHLVEDADCGV